ncbi:hypothetical protein BGZ94_000354 [Podila epigama]|nr:hypothetical protein BGZ94_000354 [Podila epigama]
MASRSSSKKISFTDYRTSDSETDTDNDIEVIPKDTEYYDPVYFDSDSDEESQNEGPASNSEAQQSTGSVAGITESMKSSSITATASPAVKSGKKVRKLAMLSDADLLYDPDEDDRDGDWLVRKIAANRPPGTKPEDIWTDAILACPMCLTQLCFDCQKHEIYPHQFRAMFVEHCKTVDTEVLRFAKEHKGKKSKSGASSSSSSSSTSIPEQLQQQQQSVPEFKPSVYEDAEAIYHPVVCELCNTKVAVIDGDEVYHFFNVIPSQI